MKFKEHDKTSKKYNMGGSDWMVLQPGENKVRIVSTFEDFGTHYDTVKKKTVVCVGKEECVFCQNNMKPRAQFLGWVIDRKDEQLKILRIGYKIVQQIGELAKTSDYGFDEMPDYDLIIRKSGQGLDTSYVVLPAKTASKLTEEELKTVEEKAKDPSLIVQNMKDKVLKNEKVEVEEAKEDSEDESDE
jgi:hypothetical protein